jgi:hypothetical protein
VITLEILRAARAKIARGSAEPWFAIVTSTGSDVEHDEAVRAFKTVNNIRRTVSLTAWGECQTQASLLRAFDAAIAREEAADACR